MVAQLLHQRLQLCGIHINKRRRQQPDRPFLILLAGRRAVWGLRSPTLDRRSDSFRLRAADCVISRALIAYFCLSPTPRQPCGCWRSNCPSPCEASIWTTTGLTKSAAGAVVREAPTPHRTYPLPCLPEQRPDLGGATQRIPGIHYPEFSEDPGYTEERHAAC